MKTYWIFVNRHDVDMGAEPFEVLPPFSFEKNFFEILVTKHASNLHYIVNRHKMQREARFACV